MSKFKCLECHGDFSDFINKYNHRCDLQPENIEVFYHGDVIPYELKKEIRKDFKMTNRIVQTKPKYMSKILKLFLIFPAIIFYPLLALAIYEWDTTRQLIFILIDILNPGTFRF